MRAGVIAARRRAQQAAEKPPAAPSPVQAPIPERAVGVYTAPVADVTEKPYRKPATKKAKKTKKGK